MTKEQKHASELMPKSEEALHILKVRAEELAQQEMEANKNNGIAYIRFRLLQNESYGIPYQYVQKILYHVTIAKTPFVPNFVAGIINWQGSLIPVIDLSQFFHPHSLEHYHAYVIIISVQNMTLGLLAERVENSATYQPNLLSPPLSSVNVINPEYILGLHQTITAILNIDVLVSKLKQEIKKNLYRIGDVHGNPSQ